MKIKFSIFQVWYDIAFNGRNVLELYGPQEDIKQFCDYLESAAKNNNSKVERICIIRDFFAYEGLLKNIDKFDIFVIENAQAIANDAISEIAKKYPDHHWLLCGYNMPDHISSDNICRLECDEDRSHFWNVFVPFKPTLYSDLKFSFSDNNYRINMGRHNAILIRGNSGTGKTMMCDTLNNLTSHVQAWIRWNGNLEGFLTGSDEVRFDKICVLGLRDLSFIKDFFTIDSVLKKYKVFVIDHADILINSEIEKIIEAHPEHKWILIGNYKPDFISDDAVCIWKNEGRKFWNEFVSETN